VQNAVTTKDLLSFFTLIWPQTIILRRNRPICFQIETKQTPIVVLRLHIVILPKNQGCCVRKQQNALSIFYYSDDLLQNDAFLCGFVSKTEVKHLKCFTNCQIRVFLTIKTKPKQLLSCQNAVPLHRQLTERHPKKGLVSINKVKREKGMKKIEAIIRKTKFEDVKEALLQSDIDWFEYHNVHGIGQSRQERIYRGVQYSTDVIERVALTIVCRDQFVQPTVEVILKVAHTGEVGDGRIFVSDMIDTWSIRTGEHGDTVLRDKK
jgi:nitrogen regulatory protein P-II 1